MKAYRLRLWKPCIVSNVRGNTELIDDNGGIVVDNNVDAFAEAILLIVKQKKYWKLMGQYNRKKVKNYSNEVVFKELDNYYKEC